MDKLALTPKSRGWLGLDLVRTHSTIDENIEKLVEQGAEISRRRELEAR